MTYEKMAEYRSKKKPGKVYIVKQNAYGQLSCNCPSWIYKTGGTRFCPHIRRYLRDRDEDLRFREGF